MSTFMLYRIPYNTFTPSQWTRTLIWTLQEYTYSQWIAHITFVHVAIHSAARATHRHSSLITQITEAYNNSSSIPINKLSFTFGIPLTLQLDQTTNIMEAWLLQFQASQKCLANVLKQEHSNQEGKITKLLISCTHGHCSENHLIKWSALIYLIYINIQAPWLNCNPNKLSRLALLWCTLKFNSYLFIWCLDALWKTSFWLWWSIWAIFISMCTYCCLSTIGSSHCEVH